MVGGATMDTSPETKSGASVPAGGPILGFNFVVAPINKVAYTRDALLQGGTVLGNVSGFPREIHAEAEMAPDLHIVIRKILEEQKVSPEVAMDYIRRNPSHVTYNKPFKILWALLKAKGIEPRDASNAEIADALVQIFVKNKNMARQAYSGVVLIPGRSDLRFSALLKTYKHSWNLSLQKYADFWNPQDSLMKMAVATCPTGIKDTRDRLVIVLRFLDRKRVV